MTDTVGYARERVHQAGAEIRKAHDLKCAWHPERGKGSHGSLFLRDRFTVVRNPKDELKTGTLHGMLKQLNLKLEDL